MTSAAARAVTRIIPARAGFTHDECRRAGRDSDHPRSRGVYCLSQRLLRHLIGSSPLARGLPIILSVPSGFFGIIPARAGFTLMGAFSG